MPGNKNADGSLDVAVDSHSALIGVVAEDRLKLHEPEQAPEELFGGALRIGKRKPMARPVHGKKLRQPGDKAGWPALIGQPAQFRKSRGFRDEQPV